MKIKLSQLRSIIREEVAKTYSQYNKEGWPKCEKPGCRGRMKPALSGRKTSLFCGICGAEKKRGLKLESGLREENTTTFECRLCGDMIQGEASPEGPRKAGWSSLAGIDGPGSVCPECAERVRQDPSELDDFRDEYPNVRLAENSMETGKCPKCRKSVRLTSNGLISYHDYVNPLGETQNCPGSQNEPV